MKIRIALISLLTAASFPALADSAFPSRGGEAGNATHAPPTSRLPAVIVSSALNRNPASADGWQAVGGEAGSVFAGFAGTMSRGQVMQELMQARLNPISADGWLAVGGEAGAVYVGTRRDARTAAFRPYQGPSGLSRSGHMSGAMAEMHTPR